MLIPTRRRTWGPQGKTPLVKYLYKHDRISALATLTLSSKRKRVGLYAQFQRDNFKAHHVAEFLKQLLREIRGPIILLWDQGKIHKGPRIQKILDGTSRLQIEFFPKYAPELNPVEQIWNDFKRQSANSLPLNTNQIRRALHASKRRVSRSQTKLRSFIRGSDLPDPF